jgi:hypothetical protein
MQPDWLSKLPEEERAAAALLVRTLEQHPATLSVAQGALTPLLRHCLLAPVPNQRECLHRALWDAPTSFAALPAAFRALRAVDPFRFLWCVAAALWTTNLPNKREPAVEQALHDAVTDPCALLGMTAAEALGKSVGWESVGAATLQEAAATEGPIEKPETPFAVPEPDLDACDRLDLLRCLGRLGGARAVCPELLNPVREALSAEDPRIAVAAREALRVLALYGPLPEHDAGVLREDAARGSFEAAVVAAPGDLPASAPNTPTPFARALFASLHEDRNATEAAREEDAPAPRASLAEPVDLICLSAFPDPRLRAALLAELRLNAKRYLAEQLREWRAFSSDEHPVLMLRYAVNAQEAPPAQGPLLEFLTLLCRRMRQAHINGTVVLHRAGLAVEKRGKSGHWEFRDPDLFLGNVRTIAEAAPPGSIIATANMARRLRAEPGPFETILRDIGERQVTPTLAVPLHSLYLPDRFGHDVKPFYAASAAVRPPRK